MGKLNRKLALVTGGTSGIGLATVKRFAAEGADVTATGSSRKSVDEARLELDGVAKVVLSDAGSSSDVAALAEEFRARGGLDVVFLNAGIAKLGRYTELDERAFDETFRINVKGPWLALKHLAPVLREGATVVITTSINGHLGMLGTSAYAASKAAARSLVRTAAAELATAKVRVNGICPGPIETPLYGKVGLAPADVEAFAKGLIAQVPLGRFGSADEVAKAVLFLASDDSSFITGEELVIDGGMIAV